MIKKSKLGMQFGIYVLSHVVCMKSSGDTYSTRLKLLGYQPNGYLTYTLCTVQYNIRRKAKDKEKEKKHVTVMKQIMMR